MNPQITPSGDNTTSTAGCTTSWVTTSRHAHRQHHLTCCIDSVVSRGVQHLAAVQVGELPCKHTPPRLVRGSLRVSPSSCAGVKTCLLTRTGPRSQSSTLAAAAPGLAAESAAARCGSDPVRGFLHWGCAQGCSQQQRPPGRCCWAVQLRLDPGPHQPLQRSCLQDAQPARAQQGMPAALTRREALGFAPCCPYLRQC